jgi:hypothetical protein
MSRSNKDAWLSGQGDLREEEVVVDFPNKGDTLLVRALPAIVSARVQSQMRLETEGREQVAKMDVAEMEILQFAHGVIDPKFSEDEARQAAGQMGPAFRKVVSKIDELSGIDKEAIEQTELRFPDSRKAPDDNGRGQLGAAVADPAGVGS